MSRASRSASWRRERLTASRLYVLLIPELYGGDLLAAAAATLQGGADIIQLRVKDVATSERTAIAERLVPLTRHYEALLIVNDDPEAARRADADGVHVGAGDASPTLARQVVGKDALVGFSTHGMEDILQAVNEPVDYLAIGSIFATTTKSVSTVVGPQILRRIQRDIPIKTFAIGGITRHTLPEVIACGGSAVAVSSAILRAPDVAAETRWFADALRAPTC